MPDMSNKKNILIISPESWSHIYVSKHHYASELNRRGHNVYFLNPPDPHKCKELFLHKPDDAESITVIDYPRQIRGLRLLPSFIRTYLNRVFLNKLERLIKCKIDVIWNFENSRFFDMQFAGKRLKIYHQVDLNQIFNLREAASSADICFCTTDLIKEQILPYNDKVYKIHHGTANDALAYKYSTKGARNEPIQAVYIGNMDMAFMDRELLKSLIYSFPDVQFRLVGPYNVDGETYQSLKSFQNIEWLGKQPATNIPSYLDAADVLLVLYSENYHKDQASPHKFMEYFASGRVIVATYTDEYKDKRRLLVMCDHQEEYLSLFGKVINDIEHFNCTEKQQERKAFAKDNSYSNQVDKILNYCKQSNLGLFYA